MWMARAGISRCPWTPRCRGTGWSAGCRRCPPPRSPGPPPAAAAAATCRGRGTRPAPRTPARTSSCARWRRARGRPSAARRRTRTRSCRCCRRRGRPAARSPRGSSAGCPALAADSGPTAGRPRRAVKYLQSAKYFYRTAHNIFVQPYPQFPRLPGGLEWKYFLDPDQVCPWRRSIGTPVNGEPEAERVSFNLNLKSVVEIRKFRYKESIWFLIGGLLFLRQFSFHQRKRFAVWDRERSSVRRRAHGLL